MTIAARSFHVRMRRLALAAVMGMGMGMGMAAPAVAQGKVLKFVPEADLRSLDPIWTTAYVTRNHGYMVYDVLFATDANFTVQPQMVDQYRVSRDQLSYTFTLRDGLKFHDGTPVRPADCIASIERWARRDVFGQRLAEVTESWSAVDARTFRLKLKKPFPRVLEALAKPSSNVPFIMPERIARTDAYHAINDAVGSGPFKFVKEQWVPGKRVVYVKNTDYVPRKEAPSWGAGGKVVKVDRVEWIHIPDAATAAAALNAGEVDWWQQVPADLVPLVSRNKDVKVESLDPLGSIGLLRFNHLHPPFKHLKMRQAVLAVLDQEDYAIAIAGDAKNGRPCPSFFTCGTPLAGTAGSEALTGRRDLERARALVREAGYRGEKVVLMTATDQPIVNAQALVTQELLRRIGLNVELSASDWGTLITRRSSKESVEKGGWSLFHTWFVGADLTTPALHAPLRGAGDKSWFGWPTDPVLEDLRDVWFKAPTPAEQKQVAEAMQRRAFETLPYIPTAQFVVPTAYRANLSGVIPAPVTFLWNVEKR